MNVPAASAWPSPAPSGSASAGAAGRPRAMAAAPSTSAAPGGVNAAAAAVTVRGRAWNDRDRDGIRDAGGAGQPVAVFASGELTGESKTDLTRQLVDRMRGRDAGDGYS
ncbi:hypothetical protein [Dactylosporangium sp. CA-233914]|uniref:hypothetical protein n=1 Tax=Dactylosporangium sp. CA-233914 TaxID=3239934 RepID=UPI003D8B332B